MSPGDIVNKLWNYCHVLRDEGMSYGDYVEQLTYLLFLKMADERTKAPYNQKSPVPEKYSWPSPHPGPLPQEVTAASCSISFQARAVLRSHENPALGSCLGRSAGPKSTGLRSLSASPTTPWRRWATTRACSG